MSWITDLNRKLEQSRNQEWRTKSQGSIDKSNALYWRARSSLDCFLLRSPGIDLMDQYDEAFDNNLYKYLPSFVYNVRKHVGFDNKKIIKYVKKHLGIDIDNVEATKFYRMYPWLTDQPSKFMLFETARDLQHFIGGMSGKPGVITTDYKCRSIPNLVGFTIEKVTRETRKQFDNDPQRVSDFSNFEVKMVEHLDAERQEWHKNQFLNKVRSKTVLRFTETKVEVNEFGKVTLFDTKSEALEHLRNYILDVNLRFDANRITRIIRDGAIIISQPAGKGSGKGGKIMVDAYPGLTVKIAHVDNGYKVDHLTYRRNSKKQSEVDIVNMLDDLIAKQKLNQPETYYKKR